VVTERIFSLDDSRTKIERAYEHLDNLHREVERFIDQRPCMFTVEEDPEPPARGANVFRVRFAKTPAVRVFLARCGIFTGEIAHHLRSSLNHLIWNLIRQGTGTVTSYTEFPIFADSEKYRTESARKVKGVPLEALTFIEQAQPYNRLGADDPLWLIHRIDIEDKHNVPVVTLAGVFMRLDDCVPDTFLSLEDGAVVRGAWTRQEVGVNADLPIQIALPQVGQKHPRPLVECLFECIETTERAVDQFAHFF
jgi:hypothetical protein